VFQILFGHEDVALAKEAAAQPNVGDFPEIGQEHCGPLSPILEWSHEDSVDAGDLLSECLTNEDPIFQEAPAALRDGGSSVLEDAPLQPEPLALNRLTLT
jgi:hypothetical protein